MFIIYSTRFRFDSTEFEIKLHGAVHALNRLIYGHRAYFSAAALKVVVYRHTIRTSE